MQRMKAQSDAPPPHGWEAALSAFGAFDEAIAELRQPFVVFDAQERLVAWNRAYADLHRDKSGVCVLRPGLSIDALTEWRLANGFFFSRTENTSRSAATGRAFYQAKGAPAYQLGDGRWMLVERYPLPDGRNIGLWIDITELKRTEAELERAQAALHAINEELESRIEERTRALIEAQDELLKKQKLSVIGQLTATVAHELRNPMSAIKNTVYALKEGSGAASPLERPLARIERSIARCDGIIEELLDYSRSRALQCETLCFDAWLGEVLAELAIPPGIARHAELGAAAAMVKIDRDRLRRVIINLLDNAAQALSGKPGNAPRILVRTGVLEGAVELTIEDNGPGIPPETLAKVFEPLFTTKRYGTGLGLPTVKQIIEQHGGTIALASVAGEYMRATIRLPRAPG
jgi:signal transduction histidine kinase